MEAEVSQVRGGGDEGKRTEVLVLLNVEPEVERIL
jgi:hypothetical protein